MRVREELTAEVHEIFTQRDGLSLTPRKIWKNKKEGVSKLGNPKSLLFG